MNRIPFFTLVVGPVIAIVSIQPELNTLASSPDDKLNTDLESRVERLENLVQKLSLNLERMQIADKNAVVNYDYENGFSIIRFYQLKPFAGKLTKCVVFKRTESFDSETEGVTCRLFVERESDGKRMVIDNFKTLPGSKEKLDVLTKQNTCNFPHDIWSLRHSALYD